MSVQSIMTTTVISASPDVSVRDAMQLIDDNDIRHLPIIEQGRLVGIVSDRDLRTFERDDTTSLREVMSHDPLCMDGHESIEAAIDVMLEYKVGALPVIGADGEFVGIVSYIDVLRYAKGLISK